MGVVVSIAGGGAVVVGSIGVEGLAEGVDRGADAAVHGVPDEA